MSTTNYGFQVHAERLAIARLAPADDIPTWARGGFVAITRTAAELSIVCAQAHVPADIVQERDKIAFGIVGTVPMTTIGLLASLCTALAEARVPVFVISTYDTDWLLVSANHFDTACAALVRSGYRVTGEMPQ
ncbi:MAG: ACT domain-containing protein [Planctomycetes bacterium]|nr:ACT domain-containing protein [Planctomycetota bacterium]